MASVITVKEKKFLDRGAAKLKDLTPKGTVGVFRRCYYQYYKYDNVKKGTIIGVSMLLASYMLFNYCLSLKELKHQQLHMYH
uniref:ATP synthase F(0) complex subunit f, mitochondrial n=1 Tax=Neovison vison TaxID=452646 RepID=A0A8C7BG50_NEOVI